MGRGWAIGLAVLAALGGAYVATDLYRVWRVPEQDRLVGKWRLYTDQPNYWHIVLREDGTGTMSWWDYRAEREREPVDIVWSADTEERELSMRAVQAERGWGGELGGAYKLRGGGEYLELHHVGGQSPGTLMYSRGE